MNYALRDIDMKFYKQYHASVSPVNLSPVFTAFIDEFRVAELVNKNEKELNEEDFETMAKYLSKLYRMAYEEYFEEINVDSYVIRELFLDEVKYSYYYLYREWTEWENTKKPEPAQQYVSLGQSVSSVMNELEDSLNEASLEEAMERDEFLEDGNYYISVSYIEEYEVTKTREVEDTCTRKVKVNPFCVGDKCAMKEEEYDCSYTQTYKEVETRTGSRTITVKKYSVRDVVEGSEKWITDRSKAEKDCDRESIQHSKINDFALDYHPESATYKLKDCREKTIPWEERTIDRMDQNDGVIVRSNRRWTVRKFEDVVHDIVWEWNPTVHNEFAGDTLHLYKYDTGPKNTLDKDFPIEIDVEIDKRSLYREYYVAKDNYTESYQRPESFFTERDCNLTEEYIKMLKDVFIQLMSGVYGAIDGGPDFEGCPDAWLNPPEGMNPFPYGQCTWFAFGMWYQTYHEVLEGIDAAHYGGGNGKNVVDNLIAARAEFGDFEYADYASGGMPVPGSLISFSYADGIYAEYGHVAFVTEVGEDGSITVIEGNIEGRLEAYDYEDAISSSIGITTYSSIDELCTRRNYDYVHFANPVESPQS